MSKKTTTKQQQNSTATNTLDPTQAGLLYGNVDAAKAAAATLTPFSGQRVAGFNDTQTGAQQTLLNVANSNVGQPLLNVAGQAATGAAGYKPLNIAAPGYQAAHSALPTPTSLTTAQAANAGPAAQTTAATINRGDIANVSTGPVSADQISAYFNPYQASVVGQTNADLDRQRQLEQVNNSAIATKQHAFGGTGAAVLASQTNDNFARQAATADANLNQSGYSTALAAAQADAARKLSADQGNQGVDLGVAGQNAGLLNVTNLANTAAQNTQAGVNAGFTQQANLNNAAAGNQNAQFNAGLLNTTDLANTQAANTASQFSAGQDLAAQQANQSAGLDANGQSIAASGLLGNLSNEQQAQAITNAGLLGQVGDAQQTQQQKELQAALDAHAQGQQLTLAQQQLINQALALIPAQQTVTSSGSSNTTEKKPMDLAGLGSLLSGIAAF